MSYAPNTPLSQVKKFPEELEYDLHSYKGRFQHFMSMTDPSTILTTAPQLEKCKEIVNKTTVNGPQFNKKELNNITVAQYKDAVKRVRSTLHPDSGEPIFLPFRFSFFLPANLIILTCMLHPSQQTAALGMLWQFVNQTYNVGFNYCNASGKTGLPFDELMTGYAAAATTACSLSYLLTKFAEKRNSKALRMIIPFVAVATAGVANVSVIRLKDVLKGIPVKDQETKEYIKLDKKDEEEKSVIAGRIAVGQVATSRVIMNVPLVLVPPFLMSMIFETRNGKKANTIKNFFVQRKSSLYLPVNLTILTGLLAVALPMASAFFPQDVVRKATALEEKFHHLKNSKGHPIEEITFNKGL
ncbi:Tricarboxylate carrier, putative [Angomonas deanei]|uniref:Tricarboxylate carrier, putative n=1 Tax=Angomonas deanei TaxID=59799 RepID=A0A7G2C907_9TRYP|nr:Tricarboxylate carrier, putative [Angomonas deanei]